MTVPKITKMEVVPVAGYDSILLNLSGAHGPYFTRNVVVLTDDEGRTGLGEVPGGEKIRKRCWKNLYLSYCYRKLPFVGKGIRNFRYKR